MVLVTWPMLETTDEAGLCREFQWNPAADVRLLRDVSVGWTWREEDGARRHRLVLRAHLGQGV